MDKLQKEKYDALKAALNDKYDTQGIESFSDNELLTFLLTFTEPGFADVFADRLIADLGSLENAMFAEGEKLINTGGISVNSAALLKLIPELNRLTLFGKDKTVTLRSPYFAKTYFRHIFAGSECENIAVTAVDDRLDLIGAPMIISGSSPEKIQLPTADITAFVVRTGTPFIFMGHCHPDGDSEPSDADIFCTREVTAALKSIGVYVIDHIITGKNSAYSMRTQGFEHLFPIMANYLG